MGETAKGRCEARNAESVKEGSVSVEGMNWFQGPAVCPSNGPLNDNAFCRASGRRFAHSPFRPFALSPYRRFALLNHARLGSPILGPGCIVVAGVCRHLQAEGHGMNPGPGNNYRHKIISGCLG